MREVDSPMLDGSNTDAMSAESNSTEGVEVFNSTSPSIKTESLESERAPTTASKTVRRQQRSYDEQERHVAFIEGQLNKKRNGRTWSPCIKKNLVFIATKDP